MPSLAKDVKIVSSVAGAINTLSVLRTVLTVGIIVFTVLEMVTTLFKVNSDNFPE